MALGALVGPALPAVPVVPAARVVAAAVGAATFARSCSVCSSLSFSATSFTATAPLASVKPAVLDGTTLASPRCTATLSFSSAPSCALVCASSTKA